MGERVSGPTPSLGLGGEKKKQRREARGAESLAVRGG